MNKKINNKKKKQVLDASQRERLVLNIAGSLKLTSAKTQERVVTEFSKGFFYIRIFLTSINHKLIVFFSHFF